MDSNFRLHLRKIFARIVAGVFVLGFFIASIGAFTNPVMSTWFVGTQRPRRGFLWMLALALFSTLLPPWRGLPRGAAGTVFASAGWALLTMVLGIVPFLLHRVASHRLPGFLSTFPLPVYAVLIAALRMAWLPASGIAAPDRESPILTSAHIPVILGADMPVFFVYWFAATLVWAWNQGFRQRSVRLGLTAFTAVCVLFASFIYFAPMTVVQSLAHSLHSVRNLLCLAAILFLFRPLAEAFKSQSWQCRPETLAILRNPATGENLQLLSDGQGQELANSIGERFPMRGGIPDLRRADDMTGANEKYNRLYELVGGFYDDAQRVSCALAGFDLDAYVMSYLGMLEVKPGDSALETAVGTGLNFKYLPRDISLVGVDLSPEMLTNCQANMRRWHLNADLFLGNAECLPFADSTFDVVFHVGGINFFNDRAKAIAEMIRVAKPGCRILIADETEEHVKSSYESSPVASSFFKDRKQAVEPPLDLVPGEMLETHLEILNVAGKNRFYAITFRKPAPYDSPLIGFASAPQPAATASLAQ